MNRLIYIVIIGILFSCNPKMEYDEDSKSKVIHDTALITENIVDTVFIEKIGEDELTSSIYYIQERLPDWFIKTNMLVDLKLQSEYDFDNRLNPLYLEEDFNGDGVLDIVIPIKQTKTLKMGFAIIHGQSNEIYIIGAGTEIRNGLSDDMSHIDIWKINREKKNYPGLEENTGSGKDGELILENPSLQIEKSELGGGQVYWNGNEYAYFHQTC